MCVFGPQYKILNVPLSSHLAANHFNQQQAEQEERMKMKKLTLDINERQEQEDYQGTTGLSCFHILTSCFMSPAICTPATRPVVFIHLSPLCLLRLLLQR